MASSRNLLGLALTAQIGFPHVIDHGMTKLLVGEMSVFLEQDALAFRHEGRLHICEIKGFPLVDGTAEPDKVGAAARQSAVYLASVIDTLADLDLDPDVVSPEVVLICPRNYTIQPTATTINVSRELRALRRQLQRRHEIDEQIADFDLSTLAATARPTAATPEAQQAHGEAIVAALPYRYAPTCLGNCDLGRLCRVEATDAGSPCTLGDEAANLLALTTSLERARQLAAGAEAGEDETETAAALRRARSAQQALATTPTVDADSAAEWPL